MTTSWCASRWTGHCARRWSKYGYGSATSSLPKKSIPSKSVTRRSRENHACTWRKTAFLSIVTTFSPVSTPRGTCMDWHEDRLLIDGELVAAEGGATYDTINPATEEVLGASADATVGDARR